MCTCPQGCVVNPVNRNYLKYSSWELKYRYGWYGPWGLHADVVPLGTYAQPTFDPNFVVKCDNWMYYLNNIMVTYGALALDWIGTAGAGGVCDNLPYHSTGRAFDLTAIMSQQGTVIDMNQSWQDTQGHRRRYCAVAASARIHFASGGVLTAGYPGGHENHIHVDDWNSWNPLNTASGADRLLMRRFCKEFNGSSIPVNTNAWDAASTNAFNALLSTMKLQCTSPTTNGWDSLGFLDLIVKNGMAGQPGSFYRGTCP